MKNHAIHSPQPILSLHLAVMMFGLSGVIGRIVHVSSVTLAGGRVLCSSLVLLAMLLFRKQSLRAVSGKDTMLTCLAGLLLAFCIPQKCFSAFLAGKEIPPWLYCLKLLGLAACTVLAWSFLVNGSYNPFLYFQF